MAFKVYLKELEDIRGQAGERREYGHAAWMVEGPEEQRVSVQMQKKEGREELRSA